MSSSSAIPTRAGALPRTSPHVSSTHHRLIRQGAPAGGVVLQTAVAPPGAQLVLNFRDASSSRSTTPHPFPADSLGRHPPSQLQLSTAGCARSTSGLASSNRSAPDNPTERWNQHVAATQRKYRQLPQPPPSAQQQQPLWGAGTRASPTAAAVSLRNPALPYHTGQAIARPSKSSSLPPDRCQSPLSPGSVGSGGSSPAAAMSFFARAAQRLGAPSRKKKHRTHNQPTQPTPLFPTNFRSIIANNPPPVPAYLLKPLGRLASGSSATTKVMLRVCPMEGNHSSVLNVDSRLRQLILFDPSSSTAAHSLSQRHVVPPKMFAFDAVFTAADPLAEVCAAGLVDIIQSVVGGVDGCLFCYGHARIGKTYTMLGVDDSPATLGVIPCAIDWLFRLINDQKEQTGARFSVRVSAVEITGKHETLKDLLADIASATEANGMTSPGVYLRDDPVCGTQLENQSELRAPTAERAAYFLDAAIAARTVPDADDDARNSHLLFTIHVYQYRVERTTEGQNGVAGGRSRLHLLDLGSCSKSKDGTALSLSALGTVLLALLNGQRHLPYRESKLTQLIKESMGNARSCMIAHVSPAPHAFNETLQVLQLASRVHRMRGRKKASSKMPSTSSEDSSSCSGESGRMRSGGRLRLGVRMGTMRDGGAASRVRRHLDYTSSSEQSCDTVIYVGSDGRPMSDRELTDCEGPPTTSMSTTRGGSEPPRDGSESVAEETAAELNAAAAADDDDFGPRPRRSLPPPPPPSRASRKGTLSRAGYGGHATTQGFATADGVKELKSNGAKEMWIDGPKSMLKDVEQWVDGPPEFRTSRRRDDEVGGGEESTPDDQTRNIVVVPVSGSRRPSGLPQRSRKDVVDVGGPSRRRLNCTADGSTDDVDARREDVSSVDVVDLEHHRADGDVTPVARTDVDGCGQADDTSYELPCVRPDVAEQIYDTLVDSSCHVTTEEPTADATVPSGEERLENLDNVGSQSNDDEQRDRRAEESIQNGLDSASDSPERVSVDGLARPSNDVTENVVAAGKFPELYVKPKLDLTALIMTNRESIYELQMDEELESGSRESLQQLACGSDDDWSTWGSITRKSRYNEDVDDLRRKFCNDDDMKLMSSSLGCLVNGITDLDSVVVPDNVTPVDVIASPTPRPTKDVVAEQFDTGPDTVVVVGQCEASAPPSIVPAAEARSAEASPSRLVTDVDSLVTVEERDDGSCTRRSVEVLSTQSTPTARKPTVARLSELPKPMASSASRLNRKPPPIPVRSSSQPLTASATTSETPPAGSTTSGAAGPAVGLPTKSNGPLPVSKNESASRGLFSNDSSASSGTRLSTFVGKSKLSTRPDGGSSVGQRCSSASGTVVDVDRTKQTAVQSSSPSSSSYPCSAPSTPKVQTRSRIALPSRGKDKKSKLPEVMTTTSPPPLPVLPPASNAVVDGPAQALSSMPLRLLSPYHKVTPPKTVVRSPGSQCSSDNSSSVFSDRGPATSIMRRRDGSGKTRSEVEASSGYESMILNSEEVTSSNQDSASECQPAVKQKAVKTFRKRVKWRSRSAPARGHLTDVGHIPRPWAAFLEEPVELKVYDVDDVERMTRWRVQEAEVYQLQTRRHRIQELLDRQEVLKIELAQAKKMLMVNPSSWSFDLHVAENKERDDPDYLAALETETAILEKRVRACRSRIMVVTCFDITAASTTASGGGAILASP